MTIEELYKLVRGFLLEPKEEKNFASHLQSLLGGYLEAFMDIDDSCFKEGSIGKVDLKGRIQEVSQGIVDCLDLYSRAKLGECISKMRDILDLDVFCTYVLDAESVWYRSRMVDGKERGL